MIFKNFFIFLPIVLSVVISVYKTGNLDGPFLGLFTLYLIEKYKLKDLFNTSSVLIDLLFISDMREVIFISSITSYIGVLLIK